jgi:hypothetical protein
MKQTAVKWLYLQMKKYIDDSNVPNDLLEQALEMEKEQMIEFAYSCSHPELSKKWIIKIYEQTYGGNK